MSKADFINKKRSDSKADYRRKELARIHVMKKELALEDDVYRAMLESLTGKTSSGDMDIKQRYIVINHMQSLLGKNSKTDYKRKFEHQPKEEDMTPQIRKIWAYLAEAKRPWMYAHKMSQNMFRVDRVEWCHPGQLTKIIAALELDARRHNRFRG